MPLMRVPLGSDELKVFLIMLAITVVLLAAGCSSRTQDARPTPALETGESGSVFPDLPAVDRTVYENIKKTCGERWRLENMKMDTFTVIRDRNEYSVKCDSVEDGELYRRTIRVDGDGNWINDGRSKRTP